MEKVLGGTCTSQHTPVSAASWAVPTQSHLPRTKGCYGSAQPATGLSLTQQHHADFHIQRSCQLSVHDEQPQVVSASELPQQLLEGAHQRCILLSECIDVGGSREAQRNRAMVWGG